MESVPMAEQRLARLITDSIRTTPGGRWRQLTPLAVARHLVSKGVRAAVEDVVEDVDENLALAAMCTCRGVEPRAVPDTAWVETEEIHKDYGRA